MEIKKPLVIAIDSSTTATKAIVVDQEGRIIQSAKKTIELYTPAINFYEHNPLDWWDTTYSAIKEVLGKLSSEERMRISAIGITHQRESFALFDKVGNPIRNGILWLDARAAKQIHKYGSSEIHDLSGKPPGEPPAIYKLAWLKENEKESLEKAYKIVDVLAYINWNLTGRWASSEASADTLGLLDIRKRDYSDQLLEIAGVTRDQMAELVAPGDVIGTLKKELASEWNLSQDIPIISGCGDGMAASLGSGAIAADTAYLNLGTAVVAGVESTFYKSDPVFRTYVSGIKSNYVFEVTQHSGAYLAGWFRKNLGDPRLIGEPDPTLEQEAANLSPGSDGLITLPYWNAVQSPYWDAFARGAVVGWKGVHTRAHMYRSILEGIAFEVKLNLEFLQKSTGIELTSLRVMGGGSRSKLWSQIIADVIGIPIVICLEDEISALGAAVLAMASTGVYGTNDVINASKHMMRLGETIKPNLDNHRLYNKISEIQKKLYPRLKDLFVELDDFSENYSNI